MPKIKLLEHSLKNKIINPKIKPNETFNLILYLSFTNFYAINLVSDFMANKKTIRPHVTRLS